MNIFPSFFNPTVCHVLLANKPVWVDNVALPAFKAVVALVTDKPSLPVLISKYNQRPPVVTVASPIAIRVSSFWLNTLVLVLSLYKKNSIVQSSPSLVPTSAAGNLM